MASGTAERSIALMGGLALGAGLMYFLDPQRGRRRRALVEDRAAHVLHKVRHEASKIGRDVKNRARGIRAEVTKLHGEEGAISNDVLVGRIRSRLGHVMSRPGPVEVEAYHGSIILRGDVLESELETLLDTVRSVKGVEHVESLLRVHERAEEVPALTGGHPRSPRQRGAASPIFGTLLACGATGAKALPAIGMLGASMLGWWRMAGSGSSKDSIAKKAAAGLRFSERRPRMPREVPEVIATP